MRIAALVLMIALAGCDEYRARLKSPDEKTVAVANPDYVVLRAITATGTDTAVVDGNSVSFNAPDRILDLQHLRPESAKVETLDGSGRIAVAICTTPDGGKLLHDWTSQHISQQLGVFVGGRLISAPRIMSPIDECFVLDGGFTQAEAEDVVARVRSGGSA
jgi:preprotein translocase subunit SecD